MQWITLFDWFGFLIGCSSSMLGITSMAYWLKVRDSSKHARLFGPLAAVWLFSMLASLWFSNAEAPGVLLVSFGIFLAAHIVVSLYPGWKRIGVNVDILVHKALRSWTISRARRRVMRTLKSIDDPNWHQVRANLRTVVEDFIPRLLDQMIRLVEEEAEIQARLEDWKTATLPQAIERMREESKALLDQRRKHIVSVQIQLDGCLAYIHLIELNAQFGNQDSLLNFASEFTQLAESVVQAQDADAAVAQEMKAAEEAAQQEITDELTQRRRAKAGSN